VSSYFGIRPSPSASTGLARHGQPIAAAQLATLLLVVALLLALEQRAQRRLRAAPRGTRGRPTPATRCAAAKLSPWTLCGCPCYGFVLPVPVHAVRRADWSVLPWDRFVKGFSVGWGISAVLQWPSPC
jgi:ABC-type Fe3+ transport system permease subunit